MAYRQALGRHGEDLACAYLLEQGYEILARNWRCQRGEIDIVAREGECLAFVEVKTRRGHRVQYPEDAMTETKRRQVAELGRWYLSELGISDTDWRIDLVAIELGERGESPRYHLVRAVGAY